MLIFIAAAMLAATPIDGVAAFNKALEAATRGMDNRATLALWDEQGVSLLPSTAPIAGKQAIGEFLDRVTKDHPGGRMESFELQCHDITVSGAWASEWCTEHQVVRFPGDQPTFDGRGKMLLVLHRDAKGQWRIREEMWNQQ